MDVEKLKQLVVELLGLMNEHGLGELEIEEGGSRVRLKKAAPEPVHTTVISAANPAPQTAAAAAADSPAPAETEPGTAEVLSPIVGTFYRASSPETESFVDIGDEVNEETVVCIIEAMKVMNEIKAEQRGKITAILVENGEPVEYGQPLFRVKQE